MVTIYYAYHPRAGEQVQVLRQRHDSGLLYYTIDQPDGTRAQLPAWMTEPCWATIPRVDDPCLELKALRALRRLLDNWLRSGVSTITPGERREQNPSPAAGAMLSATNGSAESARSRLQGSDHTAAAIAVECAPGIAAGVASNDGQGARR